MPPTLTASGRFARNRLTRTMQVACRRVGLTADGAELVHISINALFRLASEPVAVRIAASASLLPQVRQLVRTARWLAEVGFPAVRLYPVEEQPVVVEETGHVATFWRYLPQDGQTRPPCYQLAGLLRRMHSLPPPPFLLPEWDPIAAVRRRIRTADPVTPVDLDWLRQFTADVEEELRSLRYALPPATVHGDAHAGNLLRDRHGDLVMCDMDSLCAGPREWDLIPELVGCLRFGRPIDDYDHFAADYGFDVRTWPGWPVLRRVRELKSVTGVLPVLRSSPGMAAELNKRISTIRYGSDETWTPFARTQ